MAQVFLVYKTDNLHSYASRDIIGIATDKNLAIAIISEKCRKESEELSSEQRYNLSNIFQTQGFSGEGEFQFESVQLNTLL